jgi:hypothetical protein
VRSEHRALQQRPLRGLLPGVQITVGSAVASSGSAPTSGAIGGGERGGHAESTTSASI